MGKVPRNVSRYHLKTASVVIALVLASALALYGLTPLSALHLENFDSEWLKLWEAGEAEAAISLIETIEEKWLFESQRNRLLRLKATAYDATGQYQKGLPILLQLYDLQGPDTTDVSLLIMTLNAWDRTSKNITSPNSASFEPVLSQARALAPNHPQLVALYGLNLIDTGEYSNAVETLLKALQASVDPPWQESVSDRERVEWTLGLARAQEKAYPYTLTLHYSLPKPHGRGETRSLSTYVYTNDTLVGKIERDIAFRERKITQLISNQSSEGAPYLNPVFNYWQLENLRLVATLNDGAEAHAIFTPSIREDALELVLQHADSTEIIK